MRSDLAIFFENIFLYHLRANETKILIYEGRKDLQIPLDILMI